MDHTVGHYLDAAKKQWLAERSDVTHLRSQLDMARGRIKRYETLLQELADEDWEVAPNVARRAADLLQP